MARAPGGRARSGDIAPNRRSVLHVQAAVSTFSVVIPVYKEEDNVLRVYERLAPVLDDLQGVTEWEIVFSLDPSPDATEERILELRERDPRVKLLRFSRRFGQPAATLAGMAGARGDAGGGTERG